MDMCEALDRILFYRLDPAFRQRHDQIEWHRIVGLRHRVVHDYFGVDPAMIWVIVRDDVSALRRDLEAIRA
jgi:uncharacterized protein with HEPN domain